MLKFHYANLEDCHTAIGVVIVIDVLRAFSTAAYAFSLGAEELLLVGTVEEALSLRPQIPNSKVMGEVNGIRPDGFDFGNSPTYLSQENLSGITMIQRTTAGTQGAISLLDGHVARRSGRTSVFGAFYDSTLDRIADGAVLGGLALFFARNGVHHEIPNSMSTPMVSVILLGIIGSFLTSYTRARAEGLGIDAKVGILQRPERVFLLSAPQAFFGLALGGWVLMTICVILTVTAWITVVQRVLFVYRATAAEESRTPADKAKPSTTAEREAYGTRGGWLREIEQFGDRMLRDRENAAAQLADVGRPGDSTTRRTEAGHPTTFDRAR